MTVLSGRQEIERFLRTPDARFSTVLLYGNDHGLMMERAGTIAAAVAGSDGAAMQIVRLEGEAVAADPLVLLDEANTMAMFGGRRIIRLRAIGLRGGTRTMLPAINAVLETPPLDAVIIVEAGDLKKTDSLVTICGNSDNAAVIACYADDQRTVGDLLLDMARNGGKTVDPDAKALFQSLAGSDRIASRGEIEKLLLFIGDAREVTVGDVEASVGDTAGIAVEGAIDAAFAGDVPAMMAALERLKSEGADANMLLLRTLAHGWRLAQVLNSTAGKGPATVAVKMISPMFQRRSSIERQLRIWSAESLTRQIRSIGDAVQTVRTAPRLAAAAVDRTLLAIALAARKVR